MGAAASAGVRTSGKLSPTRWFINDELKDPKNIMLEGARNGKENELLLVLKQGMDPNERESPFSG